MAEETVAWSMRQNAVKSTLRGSGGNFKGVEVLYLMLLMVL